MFYNKTILSKSRRETVNPFGKTWFFFLPSLLLAGGAAFADPSLSTTASNPTSLTSVPFVVSYPNPQNPVNNFSITGGKNLTLQNSTLDPNVPVTGPYACGTPTQQCFGFNILPSKPGTFSVQVDGGFSRANGHKTVASNLVSLTYAPSTAQKPGPSSELFQNPYYQCVHNYYVSTTGNDSNAGTSSAPWQTLNHANSQNLGAGSCINVVASSTPYAGVTITNGGNAATSTGYLVYRCTTLDGCTVNDTSQANNSAFGWKPTQGSGAMGGNYIIVDGFNFETTSTNPYGEAIGTANGSNTGGVGYFSVHHVWVLNSIIKGFAQSGLQMNDGEYFFALHNTVYGNSHSNGCPYGVQGSGISFAALKPIPTSYTRTADDKYNPVFGATMSDGSKNINILIAYNYVYNNAVETCGTPSNPWDTDGNGIIMDSIENQGTSYGAYPNYSLLAFNIVANNGGGGIVATYSENLYVANNSCFNNYLDTSNGATGRGCIQLNGANYGSSVILNNIAVAAPTAGSCSYNPVEAPYTQWSNAVNAQSGAAPDTFVDNLTMMETKGCKGETAMYGSDTYSCSSNHCSTSPDWINVGTTSLGTQDQPPVGSNYALQSGSPAIGAGTLESYLPAQATDLGACASSLTVCP